jgi:hypothetical protein
MKSTTLHQHVAVALSLLGAWGCKGSFNVGTVRPDSALSGGQGGNPETGGSVGTDGGPGMGGAPGTGGGLGTGGWTGSGGTAGALTVPDASPVEDASPAAPDVPATEPDRATDAPDADSGLTGSGGATPTGGVASTGGMVETGGAVGTGGTTGSGGTFGMSCTTDQDCPSDATCCDGSDPSCDGTRLPAGDSANPGEFVVSADGLTVTDTVTGLVWQRDGSGARPGCSVDASLRCTWPEAKAYCASLVLGGVSGWRLPGWKELFNITDLTRELGSATADPTAFPDTPNESFWAFQGYSGSSSSGQMYVDFSDATVDYTAEGSLRVRCVRGARCYPKARFVVLDAQDNADGLLVRDTLTGLVWQQLTERPPPMCRPWADAQSYCSSLGPGFRLPTLKEMHTILTVGLILDRTFFQTSECKIAWTSSPYGGPDISVTGYARVRDEVGMNPYNWNRLDLPRGVRCVR